MRLAVPAVLLVLLAAGLAACAGVLRVATLNLAHGRKDSLNQFFLSRETLRKNLMDIADVLRQHRPQVVALQEADAASWWRGSRELRSASQSPLTISLVG